jgi:lysophospholipase L1-like esterase
MHTEIASLGRGPTPLKNAAIVLMALMSTATGHAQQSSQTLRNDLQTLASQRILFGHQSVGDNLIDGLRLLAQEAQTPLNLQEVQSASQLTANAFAHTYVAENTQTLKKLSSFEQAMSAPAPGLNLALMKFCYVDITAQTDVKHLFAQYQQTVAKIKARQPGIKVVHVTTPLTTVQTGWKATLKTLMGKAPYGVLENLKREEYNQLLRQAYGSREPLFDLARAESHTADGKAHTIEWKSQAVPALVPQYSSDGEHLNAEGQRVVARAMVSALAKASTPQ